MFMTYIPSDVPWPKKQKYVWFRVGGLTVWGIVGHFLFQAGMGQPPFFMILDIPSDPPWHKNKGYVWFRGRDLNVFWDIKVLSV
jgi:hypothetical protein